MILGFWVALLLSAVAGSRLGERVQNGGRDARIAGPS